MDRTHRWAQRSLEYHKNHNLHDQALFGIVQGGRFQDLREESARTISKMDFGVIVAPPSAGKTIVGLKIINPHSL